MTKDTSNITDEYVTELMNRLNKNTFRIKSLTDELLDEVLDTIHELEEFSNDLRKSNEELINKGDKINGISS